MSYDKLSAQICELHQRHKWSAALSTIWNGRPVIGPGRSYGEHVSYDFPDTCCQGQEIPDSQSRRWYLSSHLDVTFL